MSDTRTADERVEDLAFENRIRVLTRARKWDELRAVLLIYGSCLDGRGRTECAHAWTYANTPGVAVCSRCGECRETRDR
jgi:hypothetical protein